MKDKQNKTYIQPFEDCLKTQLKSEEFWSANAFKVTVGTNTPCGGDAGHGGKTLFRLQNLAGTDWNILVDGEGVIGPDELTIILGGDCEANTFADSLIFAGKTLKKQIRENKWNELCSRVFALEERIGMEE